MTVTYTAEVATSSRFGSFLKLLFRWRGSIYKLVWRDLIVFLALYYILNFIYRFSLNPEQKRIFESAVEYCGRYGSLIPLSFVLGFYVTVVVKRWWDQYISIPWPDPIAVYVSVHVHGLDDRGRVMRRTVMRYVCLCLTIVFSMVAPRVKRRFPTWDHLVDAGLLLENEKIIFEGLDAQFPKYPKHWLPIVWASSIITRARKEGRIRDDFAVNTIINELNIFRGLCGVMLQYDFISVPLVYTQVVTLAVYSYFLCSAMGQQSTDRDGFNIFFPLFTTLEFFFYMGWLKVAETLINPFGEDDDDFEINWMIDRNLQVSYLIVDEMHHDHPDLVKDQYWDEVFPSELPYANQSDIREEPPEASTAKIDVSKATDQLSTIKIDEPSGARQTPSNKSLKRHVSIYHSSSAENVNEDEPLISRNASLNNIQKDVDSDQKSRKSSQSQDNDDNDSSVDDLNNFPENDDHFERLKTEREKEREERQKQRLLKNITTATSTVTVPDEYVADTSQQQRSENVSQEDSSDGNTSKDTTENKRTEDGT